MPYRYDGETLELYSFHGNTTLGLVGKVVLALSFDVLITLVMSISHSIIIAGACEPLTSGFVTALPILTIGYEEIRLFVLMLVFAWIIRSFLPRTDVIVTTKGITFLTVIHLLREPTEHERSGFLTGIFYQLASKLLGRFTMPGIQTMVVRRIEIPWKHVQRITAKRGIMMITFKDGTKMPLNLRQYRNQGYFGPSAGEMKEMRTHFLELYRRATQRHHEEVN